MCREGACARERIDPRRIGESREEGQGSGEVSDTRKGTQATRRGGLLASKCVDGKSPHQYGPPHHLTKRLDGSRPVALSVWWFVGCATSPRPHSTLPLFSFGFPVAMRGRQWSLESAFVCLLLFVLHIGSQSFRVCVCGSAWVCACPVAGHVEERLGKGRYAHK